MSQSEIAFLALGLMLGVVAGAAILVVIRGRLAPRREVRLTISPNAIPARRSATLAVPSGQAAVGPVPGSPEDGAWTDDAAVQAEPADAGAQSGPAIRTPVPSPAPSIPADAVGIPIVRPAVSATTPNVPRAVMASAVSASLARSAIAAAREADAAAVAVATAPAEAPAGVAIAGSAGIAVTIETGRRPTAGDDAGADRPRATGADRPGAMPAAGSSAACADERHLVEERTALADAAREQARRAADALRDAQRAYDALRERVDRAKELSDPRRVAESKSRLHAAFRARNERATGAEEAEAAAREWLTEINRLNGAVREAARLAEAGGAELRAQVPGLERLAMEADAARIAAENADEGCGDARQALADCEERAHHAAKAAYEPPPPEEPHPFAHVWPTDEPALARSTTIAESARKTGLPVIVRILRGDRDAREQLVAALAGTDPAQTREWQLRLAPLFDAIAARAIEDGYLDVPEDDPFWSLFGHREAREIIAALSALGFRYDGLGGFADGRVPAARDLSLAVGYAGLDRMRIRAWPRDADLPMLLARATVAADEWLADQAGDLTLGRMVDALGGRAAELADLWNAWGRVRPILLAP